MQNVAMGHFTSRSVDKTLRHHIILAALWVSVYVQGSATASDGAGAAGSDSNICEAPECLKMAHMIRNQMGNKQPCDDFYNYVCDKWRGDRELKRVLLKKKAVTTLMHLLGNASVPSKEDLNATDKLVLAYSSCTTKGGDKEALTTSVSRVLAQYNLTNGTWPIFEKGDLLRKKATYQDILKRAGPRPVFSYSISHQQDGPIILMSKPSPVYLSAIPDISSRNADIEGGSADYNYSYYDNMESQDEESYKTFIAKSIILLNAGVEEKKARNVAEAIVDFEKNLSKLATDAKEAKEKNMSLYQLGQKLGGNFSMAKILRRDFGGLNINITGRTKVLVQYIDYYETAVILLECTSIVTLSNYILWSHVRNMAEAEGTELNKLYLEYKHNTSIFKPNDGEDNLEAEIAARKSNLSLLCVRQLLESNVMYTDAANYYIAAKFNKTFKEDVLKMMTFVNASFMLVVKNNTWMTEGIKKAIIMKLQNMKSIIGYPDWMLNETIINTLYQFVPQIFKNASFVEHLHFLLENNHKQYLLQLAPERYFNKTNEDVPFRSHAYYDKRTHTIVYPAASLVTHYRSPPIPRSVIYGTIGTILAQLLTAAIDRYSDLSEETGKYNKDSWDNKTTQNFCNRSSCLNHTEECNNTSVPMTDKYETLDDYFGVRISYQALENSKQNYTPPFLLPDENKTFDSEEKIFFTLFGSLYCPYSVNEGLVESRSADEDKFPERLNEIVYDYEEFNKTFQCDTAGKDACDLMPPVKSNNPDSC